MNHSLTTGEPLWVPVGNGRGQHSVWRADREPPAGWGVCGRPTDRTAALDAASLALETADDAGRDEHDPAAPLTVDRRFADVCRDGPGRTAVVQGEEQVTYGELAERAARVRAGLERLGVRRGSTVGICMNRGADMIVVLLGVLAAGAAYLPLDGYCPPARLAFMVRDAGAVCVVFGPAHAEALTGLPVPLVRCEDLYRHAASMRPGLARPDDIAYVMYTSGSTGQPKGVEVTHRNLAGFLDAMAAVLPDSAPVRVLFSTRLSFDIAGLEVYLPLTGGGSCVVAPDTWLLNARSLAGLVNSARPSLVQATPVGWRLLLDAGARFGGEQTLLCGGDTLPSAVAARLAALPSPAFNVYGPTEATVWATAWRITPGGVRIGEALPHARVYVLDESLSPLPAGAEGEAYIGGAAVAHGYRRRPRLTAERFVPDPWSPERGARMYATGDVVRDAEDGLEFVRRRDTQVKLRGYRIELGEIESVAESVEGVHAAVAVITDAGPEPEIRLTVESFDDARAVRSAVGERLRALLPAVMVPRRIDVLTALPLTPNGKVDRAVLCG
ncbi:amino acid adenylation domain-containing protein [Streptomyces sp. GMR22]|uniref:amino acid adenylation domain-containing protein n=1 Tax=Streptomyces sp. GMR22 TaxID=2759524 RepID=UPI0015FD4A99|nr:amino acid adenylation domain-containing protein [Streptomyces sp. GMR22]MBA6439096.1 amino acid adenylation domain-containing protein [Streptomyces sp. GMR22]